MVKIKNGKLVGGKFDNTSLQTMILHNPKYLMKHLESLGLSDDEKEEIKINSLKPEIV